jgi:hypothetical protein
VANYKCGKNQTQAKQLVAAKVWLGKLWLGTKRAMNWVTILILKQLKKRLSLQHLRGLMDSISYQKITANTVKHRETGNLNQKFVVRNITEETYFDLQAGGNNKICR